MAFITPTANSTAPVTIDGENNRSSVTDDMSSFSATIAVDTSPDVTAVQTPEAAINNDASLATIEAIDGLEGFTEGPAKAAPIVCCFAPLLCLMVAVLLVRQIGRAHV